MLEIPPANTYDNNFGTRWSASGNSQWIQCDLGVARGGVNAVAIAWYRGNARIARFAIQTSTDGATWQNVYPGQSSGTSVDFENVVIPPGSARFVRIVDYRNNLNLQNSIVEARIYSNTSPRSLTPVPVSASTVDNGNVPQNTIDSDLSTRWSASGNGQWIQYDLGAKKYIT